MMNNYSIPPEYEELEKLPTIKYDHGRIIYKSNRWRIDMLVDGVYMVAGSAGSQLRAIARYHKEYNELHGIAKKRNTSKVCGQCNNDLEKLYKGLCPKCNETHGREAIRWHRKKK